MAVARFAVDYDSYDLRRVGLLPVHGRELDESRSRDLQQALRFELARRAAFEVVLLSDADLAEIDPNRPYERGAYSARTVIEAARRFRLDGLFVATVTHFEPYPPQGIGMQFELVAAETGLVIWSSTLDVDAADSTVRRSIEGFQRQRLDESGEFGDIEVLLLSPSHLMRFAASEVARTAPAAIDASAPKSN